VRPDEAWIDVELASQTLVAYQGDHPVFATLVSTGRGAQGTELATPIGTHRIWVKLRSTNMDNLEDEDAEHDYAIEDVPYVQFFAKGVGLHGAFWHRSFGHPRSHGCVNLAPLDAARLFGFTSPRCPQDGPLPSRRRSRRGPSSASVDALPSRARPRWAGSSEHGERTRLVRRCLERSPPATAYLAMLPWRRNAMTKAKRTSDSMSARPRIIGV